MVLTDDAQVRQLNASYRHKDTTTDVLSFGLDGDESSAPDEQQTVSGGEADRLPPRLLGDVVVSVEQAARQATGGDLEAEIVRLLVHGVCHLLGHDHQRASDTRLMRREERRLLLLFGLTSGLVERSG